MRVIHIYIYIYIYIPFKGLHRALIPSFPTKNLPVPSAMASSRPAHSLQFRVPTGDHDVGQPDI